MRRIIVLLFAAGLLLVPTAAWAEGETVQVVSQDCDGIMVRGGGYTPGQKLLTFARARQGEGTITNQVEVPANGDGMMPTTTLKFGGQVPDGTYLAVITTPGPGMKEEVTKEFTVKGCASGSIANDQDCSDFGSQAEAQAHLEADASDPDDLDADQDGKACEQFDFGAAPGEGEALPFTGSHDAALLAAGLTLLAAGGLLVRWGRTARS